MSTFHDPIATGPDDLVIDVHIGMVTGAGNEIGKVERRIVVPVAFSRMWLHQADSTACAAIEREALQAVRLAILREVERRNPEGFYRRLDTLHPDFIIWDNIEEQRKFVQFAEHVVNESEIAATD